MSPDTAMVFAAGFGTRMGELAANTPKPMIKVANRPLLDYALDIACTAAPHVVVNLHRFPDQIEAHLKGRDEITTLREEGEILETGGGLKNALGLMGSKPVYTLNSDTIWKGQNPLLDLRKNWQPDTMDALLLLLPRQQAQEHYGPGDFYLKTNGHLEWRGARASAPYVYLGAQIIKTEGLSDISETSFSIKLLWEQMMDRGRIFGHIYNGTWVDVGRPQGISVAEQVLTGHV